MAGKDAGTVQKGDDKWTLETGDYYHSRLSEIRAVLSVLICNLGEFEKGDGRASDEAAFLAIQHAFGTLKEVEDYTYRFTLNKDVETGDLAFHLMGARALLEILEDMFHANSWEINLSATLLISYLSAVERLIEKANTEAKRIHAQLFQAVAQPD
jgi:hypothetical protein